MNKVYIILIFLIILASNAFSKVAVIAHKNVPLSDINQSKLLDFYTGDIRVWSDDKPVKVFDLKQKGDVKDNFYHYLGKSSSRMKSLWMKKMLSGEGDPPEAMQSASEMLKKVAATPGAIGFVNFDKVNNNIKVLAIIEEK
jgi:ABC-type phosphate transport system substrate-binding protein